MTKSTLDISVVICAYTEDRWDDLAMAVESVCKQSMPPLEIIVVIDHNPTLLERVQVHIPGVVAIENKGLPGASSARNSGVAVAQGSLIAFLDDDAVAEHDWLEQLASHYEDPKVLGVGGTLEPVWLGGRPKWFPEEFNWVVGCTYKGLPGEVSPVRNLIAANMSVRREVFGGIGGFRSGYGNVKVGTPSRLFLFRSCAGDEETDFCIQALRQWPQRIWLYVPHARVRHKVSATRTRYNYFLKRCYDEGFGKALLSQLVGAKYGLATEWTYTLRTLPLGILRGLADTLLHNDLAGLVHAGMIVVGLAVTTTGYLVGMFYTRLMNRTVKSEIKPVRQEITG